MANAITWFFNPLEYFIPLFNWGMEWACFASLGLFFATCQLWHVNRDEIQL